MKKKILVSVTTINDPSEKQLEDIKRLQIKEFAIFPTCFEMAQRQKLYRFLEKLKDIKIPFAHIRSDFEDEEIGYLVERFGMERCNIHPSIERKTNPNWKKITALCIWKMPARNHCKKRK
ncbi:MAG: hypothetical protein WC107_04185 [Patescibacteria group bacterium]